MPEAAPDATQPDTLVCLHFLGGSAREWLLLAPHLAARFRCIAIDLPGFGDSGPSSDFSVSNMADAVAARIAALPRCRWALAGHSMGAKVATVLTRRAEDGDPALVGLTQVILLAGSPPSPEPMDEKRRARMLGWFKGDEAQSRKEADGFIRDSVGAPLPDDVHRAAVDDVLRAYPAAWRAWLEHGSREDWTDRIGLLATPALVVAGSKDADLGPAAQRELMLPHYADATLVEFEGAGHLLPLERAEAVADAILAQAERLTQRPPVGILYRGFMASPRVSASTRAVLTARLDPPEAGPALEALGTNGLRTLDALAQAVIPQPFSPPIALAATLGQRLAQGEGDGWRFAALPPDLEAYRTGLATLDEAARVRHDGAFADLDAMLQDSLLDAIAAGTCPPSPDQPSEDRFDAAQMKLWFEEVRGDLVRIYMAHPATLARLGYSGIANGGDGLRKIPLRRVGLGEAEGWEPQPATGGPS